MHSDEVGLRAAFSWVAAGLVLLNAGVAGVALAASPGAYRPGFAPLVLAALGLPAVVATWRLAQGYSARRQFRAMVVVAVVALTLHPPMWVDRSVYPPLLHLLGAVACVTAVASVRWSLVVVPAFAAGAALLRAPQIGAAQAAGEAALSMLAGLVGTACVVVFARAARSVHASVEQSWQVAEERAGIEERAAARERWDGLVHDTVLGALALAARSSDGPVPTAARELAREALGVLGGLEPAEGAPAERWREHAEWLGLRACVSVDGDVADPEVREAIVRAGNEALTNVSRHAGTLDVVVAGSISAEEALVVIRDEGRGFEPDLVHGTGLRTSIVARMRGIGGSAVVVSEPGSGTTVTIEWQPVTGRAREVDTRWELGRFHPLVVLAWCVSAAVVVVSSPAWSTARWPAGSWMVVIAALGTLAVAAWAPPTRRCAATAVVAVLVVCAGGALNTPAGAPVDWRYWYLSALDPALAALSYRFRGWAGPASAAAGVGLVVALDLLAGRSGWAVLAQPVPTLAATVAAARMIHRSLKDAWETVEEATRQGAELRLALAAEAERSREARARAAGLHPAIGDALARIVAGGPLMAAERKDLGLLGAAVRDQLAAPELVDEETVVALREARRRGVVVDVVGVGAADDGPGRPGDVAVFRRLLGVALRASGRGCRVRVAWSPAAPDDCTLTVVGPTAAAVADAVGAAFAASLGDVMVSLDEEALLVRTTRLA